MKKNVMMRIASVLLICVLVTTCGISGTFAKYTSKATGTDNARVAKWGWGASTLTLDLFADTYNNGAVNGDGDKVIAPGTSRTATLTWSAQSTFKPEVDYKLTFAVDAATTIPAEIEAELDWILVLDGTKTNHSTFDSLKTALEGHSYNGVANTDAPTVSIQIGWEWAFEGSDDEADTALGNGDPLKELTISVTMTATQVETRPAP